MPRLRRDVRGAEDLGVKSPSIIIPISGAARTIGTPAGPSTRSKQGKSGAVLGRGLGVNENVKRIPDKGGAKGVTGPPTVPGGGGKEDNLKKRRTKFPERLEWKMTHLNLPSTSTPKRDPRNQKVTREDIECAFGFDDSVETVAEYSTLLSPIAHASPKGIIPPVWKVHPLSQRNVDPVASHPTSNVTKKVPVTQRLKEGGPSERRSARLQKETRVIKISTAPKEAPIVRAPTVKAPTVKAPTVKAPTVKAPTVKAPTVKAPTVNASTVKAHTVNASTVKAHTVKSTKSKKTPLHFQKKPHLFDSQPQKKVTGSSPFSQLLHRYTEDPTEKDTDGDLQLDRSKIWRTYGSRKRVHYSEERDSEAEYDFVPRLAAEDEELPVPRGTKPKASRKAPKSRKKANRGKDDDMDEDAKRWLEEKQKEFDEVLKTKLVIEQSFSD